MKLSTSFRWSSRFLGLALLSALFAAPAFSQNPPGRAARLSYARGDVSFQPSGENQWGRATLNYTVTTGDRLYTNQGGRAELEVGPYAVRMSQLTDLTMANLNDQTMQLGLEQGSIWVSAYSLSNGQDVEVDTPNGALTVLQPGSYRVDTDPNSGSTYVSVISGGLQITGGGANQEVGSGQEVQLTGAGPIQVTFLGPPRRDEFAGWSESRDHRLRGARSARYVNRYAPGYEDLDYYGRWIDYPQYGEVWYPTDVPYGWVPYRYGEWSWVQPWGWTWVDYDPWGYTPFHYGRWAFIFSHWCWLPGPAYVTPVYSPAFVAFVGGGSSFFGFSFTSASAPVGWFPLGPSEPYVPWYSYSGNYFRQINVTNVRNVTNITTITNVNNVHYVNRALATTAVPASVVTHSDPVATHVIKAPPQIAKAPVVTKPAITPAAKAVVAGRPAPAPPVRPVRVVKAPPQVAKAIHAGRPIPAPAIGRNAPPQAAPPGAPQANRNVPMARGNAPGVRTAPPPLITRQAPAAMPQSGGPPPPMPRNARNGPAARPPLVTRQAPAARPAPAPPPRAERAPEARPAPPPMRQAPAARPAPAPPPRVERAPEARPAPPPMRQAPAARPAPAPPPRVERAPAARPAPPPMRQVPEARPAPAPPPRVERAPEARPAPPPRREPPAARPAPAPPAEQRHGPPPQAAPQIQRQAPAPHPAPAPQARQAPGQEKQKEKPPGD